MLIIKKYNTETIDTLKYIGVDYEVSKETKMITYLKKIANKLSLGLFYKEHSKITNPYKVSDRLVKADPNREIFKNLPLDAFVNISEKTLENYPNSFNWETISKLNLSSEFIIRNFSLLNTEILSKKPLDPIVIINKYLDLNIRTLFETNDMTKVYIHLYDITRKRKLDEKELEFLTYLNVFNIIKHYDEKLMKENREDIVTELILSAPMKEIKTYMEEKVTE